VDSKLNPGMDEGTLRKTGEAPSFQGETNSSEGFEMRPSSSCKQAATRPWASPTIQIPECNITIEPARYSQRYSEGELEDEADIVELASPLTPLLTKLDDCPPSGAAAGTPHLEATQTPSLPPSRLTSRR
jgi:hypothetical protein